MTIEVEDRQRATIEIRAGGYYAVGWCFRQPDQNLIALVYRLDDESFRLVYRIWYFESGQKTWYQVNPRSGLGLADQEMFLVQAGDAMCDALAAAYGEEAVRVEIRGDHEACIAKWLDPHFDVKRVEIVKDRS